MFEIAVGGSRGRSRARPGVIAGEAGGDTFQGSNPTSRRGGPRSFFHLDQLKAEQIITSHLLALSETFSKAGPEILQRVAF